jgi:hypothetical protein
MNVREVALAISCLAAGTIIFLGTLAASRDFV